MAVNASQVLGGAGAVAGQALIPIPGVGSAIGGFLGSTLGGILQGKPKAPPKPVVITGEASMGNKYLAMGGMIPGVAYRVNGPRHEQGGVKLGNGVEVEGGETMVFSDRVRVPGQSYTFAKASERLNGNKGAMRKLFDLQQKTTMGKQSSKIAEGGLLEGVAPYVGDIINIGRGLLSDTAVPDPVRVDRSHIAAMPRRIDTSAVEAQAKAATRSITGNPNASTNTKLAAHSGFLSNAHQIQQTKANQEAQLQANIAQAQGRANAIDSQYANQARVEQMQADAAKSNILSEGVAGLARTYQQGRAMENARASDTLGFMSQLSLLPEAERANFVNTIRPFLPAHLQNLRFQPGEIETLSPADKRAIQEAMGNMPDWKQELSNLEYR